MIRAPGTKRSRSQAGSHLRIWIPEFDQEHTPPDQKDHFHDNIGQIDRKNYSLQNILHLYHGQASGRNHGHCDH